MPRPPPCDSSVAAAALAHSGCVQGLSPQDKAEEVLEVTRRADSKETEVEDLQPEAEQQPGQGQSSPDTLTEDLPEDLECWLERRLVAERKAFLAELQQVLDKQVARHHRTLVEEADNSIGLSLGLSSAAACTPPAPTPPTPLYESYMEQLMRLAGPPRPTLLSPRSGSVSSSAGGVGTPSQALQRVRFSQATPSSSMVAWFDCADSIRRYKSNYMKELSLQSKSVASRDTSLLRTVVTSPAFEFACGFIIILNMLVICLEVQYIGCGVGSTINHQDVWDSCGSLSEADMETGFTAMAVLFSCFFTIEFLMRLCYKRCSALCSSWMWFDLFVLAFGMVDTVSRLGTETGLGLNPMALRTARIARLMRMVKIFRGRETFQTLYLLMKSLMASKHALGWSLSILGFTMTVVGLFINQFLHGYMSDPNIDPAARKAVFDYFGTSTRMLITMFEITLGNWAPPSRVLIDNISQWWGVFIVVYRCVFCFALVHVTAAVFITETSRVASDDEVQMMRKQRADDRTAAILGELFKEIDTSNDGFITLTELRSAIQDNLMKDLLEILELDTEDIEELYSYMDSGTGKGVPQADFVQAVLRLKGQAKTSKLVAMMQLIKELGRKVDGINVEVGALSKTVATRHSRAGVLGVKH